MGQELQVQVPAIPREDQFELLLDLGPSGRTAARSLQCKSTEDDDGATVRRILRLDECRMHDSLDFAVSLLPKEG